MAFVPDLDALHAIVRHQPGFEDLTREALELLRSKGLAHTHVRLKGYRALLRLPRFSQFGFSPQANQAYQAACFERTRPSGQTPALIGSLPIDPALPMGGLIVEYIIGRPLDLPRELPALADCLARVHALPLPPPSERPPLIDQADPVQALLGLVLRQARFLRSAGMSNSARRMVLSELEWLRRFAQHAELQERPQPRSLVLTDTHPGNFLVDGNGCAIAVDLEKALYGSPAVDLAHATLYTSTAWDPDCATVLRPEEVARFYLTYLDRLCRLGRADMAKALRPWLVPMRRLTWLRTTTWFARWVVELSHGEGEGGGGGLGADYPEATDPTIEAHIRRHIATCFQPRTILRIRSEWQGERRLQTLLAEGQAEPDSGEPNSQELAPDQEPEPEPGRGASPPLQADRSVSFPSGEPEGGEAGR